VHCGPLCSRLTSVISLYRVSWIPARGPRRDVPTHRLPSSFTHYGAAFSAVFRRRLRPGTFNAPQQ
jgi:hypothetical protein